MARKVETPKMPEAVREYFRELGRKAWEGTSVKARKARMSDAARSRWGTMTAEERSAEMKRRAAVRKRNKAKARKADAPSSR
jgi:hypothetical protein